MKNLFVLISKKDNKKIIFNKSKKKKCNTNVDIQASADLTINNKVNCEIKVSLEENLQNFSTIYGTKGSLTVNQPWLPEKKNIFRN